MLPAGLEARSQVRTMRAADLLLPARSAQQDRQHLLPLLGRSRTTSSAAAARPVRYRIRSPGFASRPLARCLRTRWSMASAARPTISSRAARAGIAGRARRRLVRIISAATIARSTPTPAAPRANCSAACSRTANAWAARRCSRTARRAPPIRIAAPADTSRPVTPAAVESQLTTSGLCCPAGQKPGGPTRTNANRCIRVGYRGGRTATARTMAGRYQRYLDGGCIGPGCFTLNICCPPAA